MDKIYEKMFSEIIKRERAEAMCDIIEELTPYLDKKAIFNHLTYEEMQHDLNVILYEEEPRNELERVMCDRVRKKMKQILQQCIDERNNNN